jgi:hypothetical protein
MTWFCYVLLECQKKNNATNLAKNRSKNKIFEEFARFYLYLFVAHSAVQVSFPCLLMLAFPRISVIFGFPSSSFFWAFMSSLNKLLGLGRARGCGFSGFFGLLTDDAICCKFFISLSSGPLLLTGAALGQNSNSG